MSRDISNLQGINASDSLISAQPDIPEQISTGKHEHRKVRKTSASPTSGLKGNTTSRSGQTIHTKQISASHLTSQLDQANSINELLSLKSHIISLKPEKQEALTSTYNARLEQVIKPEIEQADTPSQLLELYDTISTLPPRARRRLAKHLFEHIEKKWDKLATHQAGSEQQKDLETLLETLHEHPSLRSVQQKIANLLDQITTEAEMDDDDILAIYQAQMQGMGPDDPEDVLEESQFPEDTLEETQLTAGHTKYSWGKIQLENMLNFPFSHRLDALKEQAYPEPFCQDASAFLDECRKEAKSGNPDDLNLFLLKDFQTWMSSVVEDPAIQSQLQKKLISTAATLYEHQVSQTSDSESRLLARDQLEKLLQNSKLPHDQLMAEFDKANQLTTSQSDTSDHWRHDFTALKSGHGNLLALASLIKSAENNAPKQAQLEIFIGEKARVHDELTEIQQRIENEGEPESMSELAKLWSLSSMETEHLNELKGWTSEHIEQARSWLKI
ncbi:hypothetical protein GZ77_04845 [Endozoicomonas montiporae]|uniref:Uncharacterized protein n=2 Tax=Endozoicomonas montiporae TaxID=1027273 RepID=A0A081NBM4_9GAMM|nr:hypothetical protein [Endozoicomonas montiporae]AMO56141.1 hypothetical protein EZMO1_2019 [Endozoicomonas montiporae CL-33]KEQ15847.1 hypothetical protein GZ77_04845 [Endozoicomonas montiporae]